MDEEENYQLLSASVENVQMLDCRYGNMEHGMNNLNHDLAHMYVTKIIHVYVHVL